MNKSKLFDIFYTLSRLQQKKFLQLVQSPYFNSRESVWNLAKLLGETPLKKALKWKKEEVFEKLFGQQPYDSKKIDYTMSFLLKIMDSFLVYENINQKPIEKDILLLQSYRSLGLDKYFLHLLQKTKKKEQKNALKDINHYQKSFHIEVEEYLLGEQKERNTSNNLQEISTKLDLLFLAQKLKDACQLLAHQAVFNQQYDFGLLDFILPYIQQNPLLLEQNPYIALYYHYYHAVTAKENEKHFQKFKTVFWTHHAIFDPKELKDSYTLALNYCIKKANLGQSQYLEELFELYTIGLKINILLENGYLNPFKFTNIAKLALKLNKIDWTKKFIKEYQLLLKEEYRTSYIHNAYAMLYFAQGQYQKTKKHLQEVQYKELFIALDTKVLLSKVYFHLQDIDNLETHLHSFRVFLNRKDILAYHQEIYQNFINFIKKISYLPPYSSIAKQKLQTEILQQKKVLEKKWLLKQLDLA